MGTLFNQKPRMEDLKDSRIISIGGGIKEISKKLDISFNEALSLYLAVAKISDYDAKDEQLSGFGELLKELIEEMQISNEFKNTTNDIQERKVDLLEKNLFEFIEVFRVFVNNYHKE